jgi:hypothetical protein
VCFACGFLFQLLYQSADVVGNQNIWVLNGSSTAVANITNLRKFVVYSIRILAFTSVGDGMISSPVSVRTHEDGKLSTNLHLFFHLRIANTIYVWHLLITVHPCLW